MLFMDIPATWYLFCARIPYTQHLDLLYQQYGSFEAIWNEVQEQAWCIAPQYYKSWQRLIAVKQKLSYYQELYLLSLKKGIWLVDWNNSEYPTLLKHIYAPPLLLSGIGERSLLSKTCVSIVGTRQATSYGKEIASQLVRTLAAYDLVFVSGLAYGIDSVVHDTAQAYQLPSTGIIAASLWHEHWGGNGQLRQSLDPALHVFLSETTKDERIRGFHFAKRNRLIAGLSRWTIVVEAPQSSGALITAQCARDENREVLVIPHNLQQTMGAGCLTLIHDGAQIITQITDLPVLMGLHRKEFSPKDRLFHYSSRNEQMVHELFIQGYSLDVVSQKLEQPHHQLLTVVSDLVLKGYLNQTQDGSYIAK